LVCEWKYEIAQRCVRDEADPEQSVITSLHEERHNLQQVIEGTDPKQIVKLARWIIKARNTLIIGLDLASTLSKHMEYLLLSLYAAPLAVINAIVIALTKCDPARSLEALGRINKEYESGNRWC
jgi:hypothetical protein